MNIWAVINLKIIKMKKLKLNEEIEITYEEAKELITNSICEYDFDNLNESTITDDLEFETVQNRKYYLTKVGRKGAILWDNQHGTKAKRGIFTIEMTWDFRHPSNFALNKNNLSRTFKIAY